jgi:predicted  nucleic acid-binding Zn-ribbon protein
MPDLKTKFEELDKRIQKLISLHKQLKSENQQLMGLNRRLEFELEEEKQRVSRWEMDLQKIKEDEKEHTNASISGIKQKINEMINEIDRSVVLINSQHKK